MALSTVIKKSISILIKSCKHLSTYTTNEVLISNKKYDTLTFSCVITEKGQTCLKYLVVNAAKFLKVCLTVLGQYAVKD